MRLVLNSAGPSRKIFFCACSAPKRQNFLLRLRRAQGGKFNFPPRIRRVKGANIFSASARRAQAIKFSSRLRRATGAKCFSGARGGPKRQHFL